MNSIQGETIDVTSNCSSPMTFFLSFFFFLPGYMMHALLALTGLVLPEMQFLLYNG